MAKEERSTLQLSVNQEQKDFIYTAWLLSDWSLDDVLCMNDSEEDIEVDPGEVIQPNSETNPIVLDRSTSDKCGTVKGLDSTNDQDATLQDQDNDQDDYLNYRIECHVTANMQECPWCLCTPCVTDNSNRQMWWDNQMHAPSPVNSKARKKSLSEILGNAIIDDCTNMMVTCIVRP